MYFQHIHGPTGENYLNRKDSTAYFNVDRIEFHKDVRTNYDTKNSKDLKIFYDSYPDTIEPNKIPDISKLGKRGPVSISTVAGNGNKQPGSDSTTYATIGSVENIHQIMLTSTNVVIEDRKIPQDTLNKLSNDTEIYFSNVGRTLLENGSTTYRNNMDTAWKFYKSTQTGTALNIWGHGTSRKR